MDDSAQDISKPASPSPVSQRDLQDAWENPLIRKVVRWILGVAISAGTWEAHRLQAKLTDTNREIDQTWRYVKWLHQQSGIPKAPDDIWTEP